MLRIYTGGPAYPRPASSDTEYGTCPEGDRVVKEQEGMSLRDHIAGMALAGLLAAHAKPGSTVPPVLSLAQQAYLMADAMLAKRHDAGLCPFPPNDPRYGAHNICSGHVHSANDDKQKEPPT